MRRWAEKGTETGEKEAVKHGRWDHRNERGEWKGTKGKDETRTEKKESRMQRRYMISAMTNDSTFREYMGPAASAKA